MPVLKTKKTYLEPCKQQPRVREFLRRLVETTGNLDSYGARQIAKYEISEKNNPMAEGIQQEKGFFETLQRKAKIWFYRVEKKSLEKVMSMNQRWLDKKRKYRKEGELDLPELEKAFVRARRISAIDIAQEIASFAIGAGATLATIGSGAYCYFKYGAPKSLEHLQEIWKRFVPEFDPAQIAFNIFSPSTYMELEGYAKFYALSIIGLGAAWAAQSILGIAGSFLDLFQHTHMDLIANRFPENKRERALKIYEKFSIESIREQTIDNIVKHIFSYFPLLPVTLRRLVAVKSERRQRECIGELQELLHKEEDAQPEIPLQN